MRVLVINAGSSSLKVSLLDSDDELLARHEIAGEDMQNAQALAESLNRIGVPDAVGHRVVHGGQSLVGPVVIDDHIRDKIASLIPLAPLHQPGSLAGIDLVRQALPRVPAVACFDTAFHAHLPQAAATYPLPLDWRSAYGLKRYGFHGLAHAYVSNRAASFLGRDIRTQRIVVCHLGSGASLCAVLKGHSVDTTMGFTPLEGVVMATRSGTIDPGMLLWLQQRAGLSADELSDALEHRSGLVGLAGTADMRGVLSRAANGDRSAELAVDVYVHRLSAAISGMAVATGGMDMLVFSGGVGENAPEVRALAASRLGFLGVAVDEGRNRSADADSDVSATNAAVRMLVISAREDLEIARLTRQVLSH